MKFKIHGLLNDISFYNIASPITDYIASLFARLTIVVVDIVCIVIGTTFVARFISINQNILERSNLFLGVFLILFYVALKQRPIGFLIFGLFISLFFNLIFSFN